MTATLLIVAALAALGDWAAVAQRRRHLEWLLKPLVLLLITLAAASADLSTGKAWLVLAFVYSLIGDIAIMLAEDELGSTDPRFLFGVVAFFAAHVCFIGGFVDHGLHSLQALAGLLVVAGTSALVMPRLLPAVLRTGGTRLMLLLGGYSLSLAAMVVLGVGTASIGVAVGAVLFLASDSLLAWDRFHTRIPNGPLAVAITYHLAQLLILVGMQK